MVEETVLSSLYSIVRRIFFRFVLVPIHICEPRPTVHQFHILSVSAEISSCRLCHQGFRQFQEPGRELARKCFASYLESTSSYSPGKKEVIVPLLHDSMRPDDSQLGLVDLGSARLGLDSAHNRRGRNPLRLEMGTENAEVGHDHSHLGRSHIHTGAVDHSGLFVEDSACRIDYCHVVAGCCSHAWTQP